MDEKMIQEMKKQHLDSYRTAIMEIISNNTNVLMDDIRSLIDKPPLDSMDSIRNKFLVCAKKNKTVVNTDVLDSIVGSYREDVTTCFDKIRSLREKTLSSKLKHFSFVEDRDVFVFYKKDFTSLNKDIRKILKEQLYISSEKKIIPYVSSVFQDDIDNALKEKMITEISKFLKSTYQKQVLDGFDIKVLVKDTILMNNIKEQSDRYLFTLENSHLLNDFE